LAVTDKATLVLVRAPEGKILVTSGSWDGEKVFLRDQALAVGNVEGRTSHKDRRPTNGTRRSRGP
jgi:phage FluMu protein gp41